jgi:hypothetical protein
MFGFDPSRCYDSLLVGDDELDTCAKSVEYLERDRVVAGAAKSSTLRASGRSKDLR